MVARLQPEPFGSLAFQCPADEGAPGEVLIEGATLRRPRLEGAGSVGDQDPVGPGLRPQLVGLVEQVGAVAGSERLADPGDVGRHLHQCLGETSERLTAARQRVTDRGRGRAHGAARGGVRRRVGPTLGNQE
jgi:hypothetical protein